MSEIEESEQAAFWPTFEIPKIEIAARQLNAAVRSYFLDSDPIPTLTLAGAAYEIVKDLAGANHKGVVLDNGEEIGQGFYDAFRRPYTTIKHADRKSAQILDFPVKLPELYIEEAIKKYYFLTQKYSLEMAVFLIWFNAILNGNTLDSDERLRAKAAALAQKFSRDQPARFFEEFSRPGALPDMELLNKLLHE